MLKCPSHDIFNHHDEDQSKLERANAASMEYEWRNNFFPRSSKVYHVFLMQIWSNMFLLLKSLSCSPRSYVTYETYAVLDPAVVLS